MKKNKYAILLLLFTLISFLTSAQQEVEMADGMRSEGKIYVVVSIILVILIGLFYFLFRMDRKINSLEKKLDQK